MPAPDVLPESKPELLLRWSSLVREDQTRSNAHVSEKLGLGSEGRVAFPQQAPNSNAHDHCLITDARSGGLGSGLYNCPIS